MKLHIRVTLAPDGRTPVREISYVETIEAAMQFVSSLRYEQTR